MTCFARQPSRICAKTMGMIRREQNQRKYDRASRSNGIPANDGPRLYNATVRGNTSTLAEMLFSPRWQGKGLT